MGVFVYNSAVQVEFDDHALAHLQLVILAKLRRNESFAFTWSRATAIGRTTVWLDRHIPVMFDFGIAEMPHIDREWLEQLNRTANSSTGLRLVPQHAEKPPAAPSAG
jgi:hypothetical protein